MDTRNIDPFYDPEDPQPGFYDVYENSEISLPKRIARRLFITDNYERSISIHEHLGSKVLRGIVMKTAGRLRKETYNSNYHLGEEGSPLDRAAKFAFNGSVFNEVVHGAYGYPGAVFLAKDWVENGPRLSANLALTALNLGLVAVQRYNRARMIRYLDRALHNGEGFSDSYQSWTDVDSSSLSAARLALHEQLASNHVQITEPQISLEPDTSH